MASGKVMIFMGDGYGKSAAALGIAMKRASEGDSIVIIQFPIREIGYRLHGPYTGGEGGSCR